jgi:hypothetical protein
VLKVRIQPFRRELDLAFDAVLGPKARSAIFAKFAGEVIEEAKQQNKQALGIVPPYDIFVDGREGAPLTSVKPDGVIRVEFQLIYEAVAWIYQQLEKHSPVLTGRYASSHELFADDVHTETPNTPPPAEEYIFVNVQPYARKIERGLSPQAPAPEGVYQAVAKLAKSKFGNIANIRFSYRTAMGSAIIGGKPGDRSKLRNPAIVVKLRG